MEVSSLITIGALNVLLLIIIKSWTRNNDINRRTKLFNDAITKSFSKSK